jgi:uncharacterized membrane protein
MTMTMLAWLVALPLLGVVTGMRTFLPMAVLCWFAYRGDLPVEGTWAAWTGHLATALIFSLLAVAEIVGDKLPKAPNRTNLLGMTGRIVFGGLVGAIVATGLDGSVFEGILLSVSGAFVGAHAGYLVRRELVILLRWKDWHVAVFEDVIAVVWAVLAMGVVTG